MKHPYELKYTSKIKWIFALTVMAITMSAGYITYRFRVVLENNLLVAQEAAKDAEHRGLKLWCEQQTHEASYALWQVDTFIWFFTLFITLLLFSWWYVHKKYQNAFTINQLLLTRENAFISATDAIFIFSDSLIFDCNPAALELLQSDRSTLLGTTWERFSPFNQPSGQTSTDVLNQKIKKVLESNIERFLWRFHLPNGQAFNAEVHMSQLQFSQHQFVEAVVRKRHS